MISHSSYGCQRDCPGLMSPTITPIDAKVVYKGLARNADAYHIFYGYQGNLRDYPGLLRSAKHPMDEGLARASEAIHISYG